MIDFLGTLEPNLLRLVPAISRARGWRLYTSAGGRLVDLWQYGGRALLGHNPPGLLRAFKNSAERGLFAPFPHFAENRLIKALEALLPGRQFRLYVNEAVRKKALLAAGFETAQWRPFLDEVVNDALRKIPVLLPILPCPFPGAPAVLAFNPGPSALPAENQPDWERLFPLPPPLSPTALAAAARSVYDLLANPQRGKPRFPKLEKAFTANAFWESRGIYFWFHIVPKKYGVLFRHFLEGGFLLPPSPADPVILPGELSAGEEVKLAALFQTALF